MSRLREERIARSVGILLGALADVLFADPRRGHPVAGFGALAGALERATYRDARWAGALHAGVLVGAVSALGIAVQRAMDRLGRTGQVGALATATWTACGGASLLRVATVMAEHLDGGDVDAARRLLPSLCGRDPSVLDADGLARAALESVAENTSDAHVGPLIWAGFGGLPAVLAYRAVNTMDAMIGHRSPRYSRFGWAAARLDDAVNLAPARLTAVLTVVCAPLVGGSAAGAARAWRSDAARHPSPNAGVVEAAFAGALGVSLGGPTRYAHRLEVRPALGDGPPPTVADLRRAIKLSRTVQFAATTLTIAVLSVGGRTGRRSSPPQ